jgi:hypothetical protein
MSSQAQAPPSAAFFVPSAEDADAVRALLALPRAAAAPFADSALFVAAAHGCAELVRAALQLLPPPPPPVSSSSLLPAAQEARMAAPPWGAPTPLHAAAAGGFAEAMLVR